MKPLTSILSILFLLTNSSFAIDAISGNVDDWNKQNLLAIDSVESATGKIPYSADILSCYYDYDTEKIFIRIGFVSLQSITIEPRINLWTQDDISLRIKIYGAEPITRITIDNDGKVSAKCSDGVSLQGRAVITYLYDMVELELDNPYSIKNSKNLQFDIKSYSGRKFCDEMTASSVNPMNPGANCALMHHGNQALAYTDVFRGRSDDIDGSGFDEVLQAHDAHNIPVNIHMSGLLQTDAAWYDSSFNSWISTGVSEGWIEMIGSAYSQHIMPFVEDNMNDWAVYIHRQMTHHYYNFWETVAWVPERTFLDGPGGRYPNDGVSDWLGNNFEDNSINAVILDDDVHCSGYDNHQIHYISGTSLRLIPRDHDFTGKLHSGDGAGALAILEGLAAGPDGDYRIVVYADDWEMAAEMGEWATSMPNAKETYDWFVNKCYEESSWLSTWKLSDAVANTNFNGATLTFTPGSHLSIGGTDGYGGGNNGWYTHWAGYASPSDNHAPQWGFGYIWSDARNNLMTAPDNNISQAGWYVMMTNLYETGWHDGLGGDISGWEMKFSTHIKNANVYAEGARWANGDLPSAIAAYTADYDHDGNDELIIYNDRIMAVFEAIGGRAVWIFAKNGTSNTSIVGNCNAYWEGTDGDYNDANHIAALSDVSVGGFDYEHAYYDWEIVSSCADSAVVILRHDQVRKRISVYPGEPYLHCEYFTRDNETYIKTGFTPDLVNILWYPDLQRIWRDGEYCGFRNDHNDAIGAYIIGDGGATHSAEFSSTILKGDEIVGKGTFGFDLYAGWASATASGYVIMFDLLASGLGDQFPPDAYKATYNKGTDNLVITFTDTIDVSAVNLSGIGFDQNADGVVDVWLNGTCTIESSNDKILRIHLSPSKASAVEALSPTNLILALSAGAVSDISGNPCRQLSNGPDQVNITVMDFLSITIDGYLDTLEWPSYSLFINDPNNDSEWDTLKNEIWGVYFYWDSLYAYFAINGICEVAPNDNSWLLYIDTDYGGSSGYADLTGIDAWDRNAQFTVSSGFKCDYQYGSYTGWTGDFWRILSATTSEQVTTDMWCETDLTSANPASEIAISWDELYGLGAGNVPPNATIALVASIASDSDLGGDSAPNNISAILPIIDNASSVTIDTNGDGIPEPCDEILSVKSSQANAKPDVLTISAYPNPFNSSCKITLSGVNKGACSLVDGTVEIYDLRGNLVATPYPAGAEFVPLNKRDRNLALDKFQGVIWTPDKSIASGIYFVRAQMDDGRTTTKRVILIK